MVEIPSGQPTQGAEINAMNAPIPLPTTAPEVTTPTPPVQSGPSVEQLSAKIAELERSYADVAERASRAEHDLNYALNVQQTLRQQAGPTTDKPQSIDISDDEFLTNPGKSVSKALNAYREMDKAEREQRDRMAYVDRARSLYETGRTTAKDKLGKLLNGIENDVAQYVQQGVINGSIDPEAATDPDLWAITAIAHRYKTLKERDFGRYFSDHATPMSPVHQETPSVGAPQKVGPVMTQDEQNMARFMNVTPEQWAAAKLKEGVK